MKIESVADAIIEEANREADEIRRAAEKEVRELLNDERKHLESKKKDELAAYEKEVAKMMDERIAAARLDAKKELQMAKDAVALKVMEEALEALDNARNKKLEYKKILESLYARARKELGAELLEIECAKNDLDVVKEVAGKNDKVKVNPKVSGGFIARDPAKNVLIDLTFATLAKDKEADIKAYIYKKLFK